MGKVEGAVTELALDEGRVAYPSLESGRCGFESAPDTSCVSLGKSLEPQVFHL